MVALSYDTVDVLAAFAEQFSITYPMLSDVGSHTIDALGLRNEHVDAQNRHFGRPTDERHVGLPYPGSFHLDAEGVVTAKQFEDSYRIRPAADVLLPESRDTVAAAVTRRAEIPGVAVEVSSWSGHYAPQQIATLHVRLAIAEGHHVYVGAVSDGFTTLGATVDGPASLQVRGVTLPDGHPLTIPELGETFTVIDGSVDFDIELAIMEDHGDVTLEVHVKLQVCTDTTCWPPTTLGIAVPLQAFGLLRP